MNPNHSRLAITPGEPAGVGPDVLLSAIQKPYPVECVVFADADMLRARAQLLNLPLVLHDFDPEIFRVHKPGELSVVHCPVSEIVIPGQLNVKNAAYVLECLERATQACIENVSNALITGPVHKGLINQSGVAFSGHTEFLAQYCRVPNTVMLFVSDQFKVALATTHIPLADVSKAITAEHLESVIQILHHELVARFSMDDPVIHVCGLNPHAGEQGFLGREDMEVIEPVIRTLQKAGMKCVGPIPADTAFVPEQVSACDVTLAMYHDQGLPVMKHAHFNDAVNITCGLPIIRTSVDHGTALSLAGTGQAQAKNMESAMVWALRLIQ